MNVAEILGLILLILAVPFFWGGSIGLLRFPDIYTRLHALTKADNLGLGLVVAGSALLIEGWAIAVKLILIWIAVLLASTVSCFLIANAAHKRKIKPWKAL
ncbi:MAG: monovalent cation/H(+) antiporter subunit G [Deltaproteobacteria bacterium]|nr:monovalent cation/H(+) antiporter subunit G [Deltaproteobacteria bacterium]